MLYLSGVFFRLYLSTSLPLASLVEEKMDYPLHRTICFNMELDKEGLDHHFLKNVISWEVPELEIQHQRVQLDVQFLKREKQQTQVRLFALFVYPVLLISLFLQIKYKDSKIVIVSY